MMELPAEQDSRLVPVFQAGRVWNAVATTRDGGVFVCFPSADGPGVQAAEVMPDGTIVPYPDAPWNDVRDDHDPAGAFVHVNSLRMGPDDHLWILNAGAPGIGADAIAGGARLIVVDVAADEIARIHDLGPATRTSYIDDFRFNDGTIYLTDAGAPGLLVIATGRAERVPLIAVVLVVVAAASWGAANICTRLARPPDPFALLVWASLVGPAPLAALSLAIEGRDAISDAMTSIGWPGLLSLLYIVVVATLFGWGAWTWLLARHPASSVAPFSLLAPVAALISTWLFRGEQPTVTELAGGAVILVGLTLAVVPHPTWRRLLAFAHERSPGLGHRARWRSGRAAR